MKAILFDSFGEPPTLQTVPDPVPSKAGVVIQVQATGLCRSDWHGWMGHDPEIVLPHVPGHELAGTLVALGKDVEGWRVGDRVTVPFVCACGTCPQCASGNQQVCEQQSQPGFTHWGSFAEYVAIERAAVNLVALPEEITAGAAASLGCRFTTAFRAVVDQGRLGAGQWIAIHGCGGVGLSAAMIANALGARVIAVDIREEPLAMASSLGAVATVNAAETEDVVEAIRQQTGGGAHVSLDALGSAVTCFNSVACLRTRGRHVQVGLMVGEASRAAVPMDRVLAQELEIVGSHGMPAHRFPGLLTMVQEGKLRPEKLVGRRIVLEEGPRALMELGDFKETGMTIIDQF